MRSLTAAELQREAEGRRMQQEQRRQGETMTIYRQMLDQQQANGGHLTEAQRARFELIRLHQSEIADLDADIDQAREDLRRLEMRRAKLAEKLTAMGVRVDP